MPGIQLVSQGTIAASGSPAFGQSTGAGHLLVAWVTSEGSSASFTTTTSTSGWALAASGGGPFAWASVWYKANSAGGDAAPVFTDPNGTVAYSQLAEYSGAAAVSPLDQNGGQGGTGQAYWYVSLPPDAVAGDLVAACGFWNGANSGGTISISQFTDGTGAAMTPALQQTVTGTGPYLYFASLWGVTSNTGSQGDTTFLGLSVFEGCSGAAASFKPASPVSQPLTITPQVLPPTWLDFPYVTQTLQAAGGTPSYTWSVISGALPAGMSLSSTGVLSGSSVTAAGTFSFTVQVADSASSTATASQSITVNSPPAGTSLTTTSSLTGNCGPYPASPAFPPSTGFNTYVSANFVDPIVPGYSQTVGAYDAQVYYVSSTAGPAGTGQVQMGPCNSQLWTTWGAGGWTGTSNTPLSVLSSLTATFDTTNPSGGAYELEFDLWTGYTTTNSPGSGSPQDVMIWLNTTPERALGNTAPLYQSNVRINGYTYDVYGVTSGGQPFGGEIIFVLQGPGGTGTYARVTSGTADILGPLNWCVDHGANLGIPPYVSLTLFGWEICNTDVTPGAASVQTENFIVNSFTYNYSLAGPVPPFPPPGIVNRAVTIGRRIG